MLCNIGLLHNKMKPRRVDFIHDLFSYCMDSFFDQFNRLFSRNMVNTHFQHTKRCPFPVDSIFPPDGSILGSIFDCQLFNSSAFFRFVLQYLYLTKSNNASEIAGICIWNNLILVDHAERNMSILPYCIQFVAAFSAVEIEILPVIYI